MRQVLSLARKITIPAVLLVFLLGLTGCASSGGGAEELALEIRTEYISATRLDMTLRVTADYGDRVYEYGLKYVGDASSGTLEIRSPESIAGLTATVTADGATLQYDGAILDTGLLDGGLSPMQAVPLLLSEWQSGYITDCYFETFGDTESLAVSTQITDSETQKVWFDVETHLPVRAEIFSEGSMVISCDFEDIIIE